MKFCLLAMMAIFWKEQHGTFFPSKEILFTLQKKRKVALFHDSYRILFGITRKFVLELAKKHGMEISVGPLPKSKLSSMDEAFLTSTTREVTPITLIDDQKIGNGSVGKLTATLMSAFEKERIANCKF